MTKERRKPSTLVKGFKEFNTKEINNFLGVNFTEEEAWSLFRFMYRIPLRFLVSVPEEDLIDNDGHLSVPLPSVGRFRIMATQPQGRKLELVDKDASYPRYKFYPSASIESEVESVYNIADEEGLRRYQRALDYEDKAREKMHSKSKVMMDGNQKDVIADLCFAKDKIDTSINKLAGKKDDQSSVDSASVKEVKKEQPVKEVKKEQPVKKIVEQSEPIFESPEEDEIATMAYDNIKKEDSAVTEEKIEKEVAKKEVKQVEVDNFDFDL